MVDAKYLFPNLDFEYELLDRARPQARGVRDQIARWSSIMRLVEGWCDARVHANGPPPPGEAKWLPWGVTPSFLELSTPGRFPDANVVRTVNSKIYSHDLEARFDCLLPGAQIVRSYADAQHALSGQAGGWILKNPFGVAGREARIIEVRELESLREWISKTLTRVEGLVLEPRVERRLDWSVHFQVCESDVKPLGVVELLADEQGNLRGHRVGADDPPTAAVERAFDAAREVASAGYFGPLSIDGFAGKLEERNLSRPICEINARMSFGRLALELGRFVGAREYTWWHPPRSRRPDPQTLEPVDEAQGIGPFRLPDFCDPQGVSETVVFRAACAPWVNASTKS